MTLQIGRVGIDVDLEDPEEWTANGEQVVVSGDLVGTVAEAKTLRQQLLGHVDNPDEPAVPVTWTEDSTVDGFYRVLSASVSTVPASLSSGLFQFEAVLERVSDYSLPVVESVLLGNVLTNSHSVTAAEPFWASPSPVNDIAQAPGDLRPLSDGNDIYLYADFSAEPYNQVVAWQAPPSWFYRGAATLEVGSTKVVAVGRQVEASAATTWRVSNGLVRVSPLAGETRARLRVEHWDGAAWRAKDYRLLRGGGDFETTSGNGTPHAISVVRNSPAEVTIRLLYGYSSGGTFDLFDVDVTLRRGDRMVTVIVTSRSGTSATLGARRDSTEAASGALAGAVYASSADANGDQYLIVSPQAVTQDTTNGGLTTSSGVTTARFGIGMDHNSAEAEGDVTNLRLQWFGHVSESQRVVGL